MTRVDFYLLKGTHAQQRLTTVCRLVHKAFGLGHRVHIHTRSQNEARALDDLLWTFKDDAFIPHGINPDDARVPVSIGPNPPETAQVLVNLAAEVPEHFDRFERVAEVVNEDPAVRDSGRARFRHYREQGCDLHHHPLGR
ncbi:DNA polymerase III subunit chi [Ectothiorhodospira variabilis]|uniref:DNA polymerase III subunit chi n=1 Tax=Ectothiorhodospira variabilis TaxID=505694 RepID=UPI001EFB84FC|nr:DNA polymerase III subunit chi [Ectothiorhodospira variabilis]MCG5495275.1 DNA polymerase III subunit chi [Ectothiorhodospira variabilis]MCG5504873.1 DNA polymerase III subunit chi [Ectothiorhodospira variabilis]MCG5508030.1 DNA polymerase III subunit chi [Ectothiorhodospira variabilis]